MIKLPEHASTHLLNAVADIKEMQRMLEHNIKGRIKLLINEEKLIIK